MDLSPGDRVDRYLLCEPLGEGGQGAVWKAQDPLANGAFVAIKLVSVAGTRPNDTERLRREARALARLKHASLLKSHALFEDLASGVLGIVMDYVEGTSLRAAHNDGRFTPELGAHALGHIARALAYVHDAGVTHRDLKLENVLVTSAFWMAPNDAPNVKLVDFGIAKDVGSQHPLTALDTVIGTLAYLAPELIDPGFFSGQQASPAVDIFAFGVLGYKLMLGAHPTGLPATASIVDYAAVYRRAAHDAIRWPMRLGTGPWADLVRDCLALNQSARLADGKQLSERIAGLTIDTVRQAAVVPPEEQSPTSIASPRAALAPTEALVAVPGRIEPPIPMAPPVGPTGPTRREAATEPLHAVPSISVSLPEPAPSASAARPLPAPELTSQSTATPVVRAEPGSSISAGEATAESAPSRSRASSAIAWATIATITSVAAVLAYRLAPWERWLHGADRAPEPIVGLPSAPTASVTRIEPTTKPDAAPEAGPVRVLPADCEPRPDAGVCPCCRSGHDCGGACDAPLPTDGHWVLRLAPGGKSMALLAAHPKARVCVRLRCPGCQQSCEELGAIESGGDRNWAVNGENFGRYDLYVTIQDNDEATQRVSTLFEGQLNGRAITRNALCEGVSVDSSKQTETIDRLTFYLDAPGGIPHRCDLP